MPAIWWFSHGADGLDVVRGVSEATSSRIQTCGITVDTFYDDHLSPVCGLQCFWRLDERYGQTSILRTPSRPPQPVLTDSWPVCVC